MVSTIETGLRRALDKVDANDPEERMRVYEAAERAILRIGEEKGATPERCERQRKALLRAVEAVEQDYPGVARERHSGQMAGRNAGSNEDAATPDAKRAGAADASQGADADGPPPIPAGGHAPSDPLLGLPEKPQRRSLRLPGTGFLRRLLPVVVIGIGALALLAATQVWDMANDSAEGDGEAARERPTIADVVDDENGDGRGEAGEWITVFEPRRLSVVGALNGGRMAAVTRAAGEALHLTAPPSEADAARDDGGFAIALGEGLVDRLEGRRVRFELTVGSPDAAPRSFVLACSIDGDSFCNRRRFTIATSRESLVFESRMPDGADEAGRLILRPGLEGASDLDVYAVRVRRL